MAESLMQDLKTRTAPEKARQSLTAMRKILAGAGPDLKAQVSLESERLTSVFGHSWRTALASRARDLAPWPLDFFLFIWNRLTGIFRRGGSGQSPGPELPPPELTTLTRRLENLHAEMTRALVSERTSLGQWWMNRLQSTPPPEEAAPAAARNLVMDGRKKQDEITRQQRWRVKHHFLPFLVLAYPFLPLAAAWLLNLTSGANAASGANIELSLGWKDVLYLVEIVLGIYLLETVYFAYSLDRRAVKALGELAEIWETTLSGLVEIQINKPAAAFEAAVQEEIAIIQALPNP